MSGEQPTDPLERLSKALEELKNSDVAALGRAFRLMQDSIDKRVMELEGKVDAIGDWIQSREAERAPEMQRPAPSPPPSKPLNWQKKMGPSGEYEFVMPNENPGLADRIAEKGGLTMDGYWYWLRNTDGAICRKPSQPRGGR